MLQKFGFSIFGQRNIKLLIFLISILNVFEASATLDSTDTEFKKIQHKYDTKNSKRIEQWHKLIHSAKYLTENEKLILVNNFFNQHIKFVDDFDLWGVKDYWATPQEVLIRGAGDCEDYSIAKYFTLLELGVPKNKLRITYVKSLKFNQAHMVVTYATSPQAVPKILDNLIPEIQTASKRKDLLPLYSFNDSGLWLTEFRGSDKQVGDSIQLAMWAPSLCCTSSSFRWRGRPGDPS